MAKEIKAVQCPKCGSTQKVEIKTDYFKCQNCDTEYYIDNDDINIYHNINYKPASQPAASPKTTGLIVGAIALLFMLAGIVLPKIFSKTPVRGNQSAFKNDAYRWSENDCVAYEDRNGKLIIAVLGHLEFDFDEQETKSGNYIAFYDALSSKELKKQRLTQLTQKDLDKVAFRIFKNGEIYAIANASVVFKINKANTQLEEVSSNFFTHHQVLATGIAQIEFVDADYGDGFKLMTNDGKSRYYFPIIDRVYTEEAYWKAQDSISINDPKVKVKIYFSFSKPSDSFPDEKIKLMMYTQKDNQGGPKDEPFFQKKRYTDDNGVSRVTDFQQGSNRAITYKDMTPGRLYFAPNILYSNEKYVLINFKVTAAQKAHTSVQCLSATDGHIVFTRAFNEEKYFDKEAICIKRGFIVKTYESMFILGMDGN